MPAIKPQNICPIYIPNQYIYIYSIIYILLYPIKSPKEPSPISFTQRPARETRPSAP